jgi:hypothetical protein
MANRIGAIIAYLKAQPALTGVPVFAPKIPTGQAKLMPADCIVIEATGGFGTLQSLGLYHQRIDVRAYSSTAQLAYALFEKITVALNAIDNVFYKDVTITNAELEIGASDEEEPGADLNRTWPFVRSSWGIETVFDGD